MPKFDIIIRAEGCAERQENGVYASSVQELVGVYQMCGENIEIIKKYPDEKQPQAQAPNVNIVENTDKLAPNFDEILSEMPPEIHLNKTETEKIITVNGERIKIVGDDVYQMEWVDYDAADNPPEIRIISAKNGRPLLMDGKIVQIKEWVKQS